MRKIGLRAGAGLLLVLGACVDGLPVGDLGLPDNNESATQVTVGSNFVSARRAGTTTGVQEAPVCDGWYPLTPNNVLEIDASLGMTITATGVNGEELRLWALAGQSNFCGEGEAAPSISRFWTRGEIDIYVGTTSNGFAAEYTLTFTPD
jgi:hypothetical protein